MSLHVYQLYREAKVRFCPCCFGTFLGTNKSLIKINVLKDNMEIIILIRPKVGTDIFSHFFILFNISEQLIFTNKKVIFTPSYSDEG